MIFVDANVILRALTHSLDPKVEHMGDIARSLLLAAERGEEMVTTTEVALHEAAYILVSKQHYGRPVNEIVVVLTAMLRLPGFRLPRGDKQRYLEALDLWRQHPVIGFADALIVTTARLRRTELATFDERLTRIGGVKRWQPPIPA